MGEVISFETRPESTAPATEPSKKVLDYISIRGFRGEAPLETYWRVAHHYRGGEEDTFDFALSEPEKLMDHIWEQTGARVERGY